MGKAILPLPQYSSDNWETTMFIIEDKRSGAGKTERNRG